jgi:hypothetical protein
MTQNIEPYIKPFMKIWFWLLILSMAGFIIYALFFETQKDAFNGTDIPSWTWLMLIMSIFLLIVSFVLYRFDIAAYNKRRALAIACGDIPAEPPKPVLQCPKKEPIQKIICKQTNPSPCGSSNTEQHIYYKNHNYQQPPINISKSQPPINISPNQPPINISPNQPPINISPNQPSPINISSNQPSPINISSQKSDIENFIPPGRG